jgi:hypothetical protein
MVTKTFERTRTTVLVRQLHASSDCAERVENSTALLERTKLKEEKKEEEDTDTSKPVGGMGSEGIHFKRERDLFKPTCH